MGDRDTGRVRLERWRPRYRENFPGVLLSCWWLMHAMVSFYWAAGGMWLVDTAVQEEGQQYARERPLWIIALLVMVGVFKLAFVLFAFLVMAPVGRKVPRFLYLLAGWGIGLGCLGYGVLFTLPVLPLIFSDDMTSYGWMRLLVWMPQFWIGGLLTLWTTVRFQIQTRRDRHGLAESAPIFAG